jgi:hypothetical protein
MIKTENEFLNYAKQQKIECGFGWYGLIMPILAEITRFNNNHPDSQIKDSSFEERQGALHIAVSGEPPDSLRIIFTKTGEASAHICRYCGCLIEQKQYSGRALCPECGGEYREAENTADYGALFDYMKEQNVQCGYGWYGLILPIISELKKWNDGHPEEETAKIYSLEPGRASLHVISGGCPDPVRKLIKKAEKASGSICEYCGCPGEEVRIRGETKILCPDCAKENKKYTYRQIEELEEYTRAKIPEFLSELSALTKKYGIRIHGCGHCGSPLLFGMEEPYQNPGLPPGHGYENLRYDKDKGRYTVEGFRAE